MAYDMDDQAECPLCMEQFEMDDLSFFPCTCGYQICRFCWHRIRTDENGLCPACRKPYSENPADFKPLTTQELHKIKAEKKQKDLQRKMKTTENRKHLANVRVVQKNLVFVVGLSPRLSDADVLKRHEYFGKFGKIHKVVINHSTQYAGSQGPSASAYVTYYRSEDALRAIEAVNNVTIESRTLKASLGTTKYCSHFMKNQSCPKTDCMYLHEPGDDNASFTKEQMAQGKHQEYEKRLHDQLAQQTQNHINRIKDRRTAPPGQSELHSGSVPIPSVVQRVSSAENSPPDGSSGCSAGGVSGSAGSAPSGGVWPLLQATTKKARARKGRKRNGGGQSPTQSQSVPVNNNSDDDNSTGSREPSDSSRSTPLSQSAAAMPAVDSASTPPPEPEAELEPEPPAPEPEPAPAPSAAAPESAAAAPAPPPPACPAPTPMSTVTPPPGLAPPTPASTPVSGSCGSTSAGEWLLPLARSATAPCGDATAAALLSQPTPPPEPEDEADDDLALDAGDDDLDFDPFEETKKGLHALLEREREQNVQRQQWQQLHQQQQQHQQEQQRQHMLRLDGGLPLPPQSQPLQQLGSSFNVPNGAPPRSRPPPPGFSGPSGLGLGLGGLSVGPQQTPDLCGSKMLPFLNSNARNGLNGLSGMNGMHGLNSANGVGRAPVGSRPRAMSPPGSLFSDLSAMMHAGQKPVAPPALARPDPLSSGVSHHSQLDWQGLKKHFPNINISFSSPGQAAAALPQQAPPPQPPQQQQQQQMLGGRFSVPGRHGAAHPLAGAPPNMPRYMTQPPKTTAAGWSCGSDWTAMDPAIVSSGQLAAPRSDSPPHWLRSLEQLTETGPMYPVRPPAPAHAHWTSTPPPGFNPGLGRAAADNL